MKLLAICESRFVRKITFGEILSKQAFEKRLAVHREKPNQIKSNLSLYSLDYAEACNELAGPISASLHPGNTAPLKKCRSGGEPLATLCPI